MIGEYSMVGQRRLLPAGHAVLSARSQQFRSPSGPGLVAQALQGENGPPGGLRDFLWREPERRIQRSPRVDVPAGIL